MSSSERFKGSSDLTAGEASKLGSFDGAEPRDEDAEPNYHDHLGSTQQDHYEMDRMGKTQELRVSMAIVGLQV
jgi:hypothetical protein